MNNLPQEYREWLEASGFEATAFDALSVSEKADIRLKYGLSLHNAAPDVENQLADMLKALKIGLMADVKREIALANESKARNCPLFIDEDVYCG